jgi:4-hydroxy-3-polyprenylbenzoate decarboxylase
MSDPGPYVIGVSGGSGAPIAVAVLEALHAAQLPVALVISEGARKVLREEATIDASALGRLATHLYQDDDLAAPISSGSYPTRGMAVVPCSGTSVARIALGLADTLLTRAAQVHLKEHRPLVLMPRESPLSPILLGHMQRLAELGVVILAPSPAYYLQPKRIEDVTAYLAGKVLDHLHVPHELYHGWKVERAA